jgi:hypothetical protein
MFSSLTSKAPTAKKAEKVKQKAFTDKDYLLNPTDSQLKYDETVNLKRINQHYGQLKLFLSHIKLLLHYRDAKIKNTVLLYIGALPGKNLFYISEMFPDVHFELYDKKEDREDVDIKDYDDLLIEKAKNDKSNVKLFYKYFDETDYHKYKGKDLILCSDIRSLEHSVKDVKKVNDTLESDQELQKKWVNDLKPRIAYLKFRVPYPSKGSPDLYSYLDGHIFKQPYAPTSSSEMRLLVTDPDSKKDWSKIKFEEQTFYHSLKVRSTKYLDPCTMKSKTDDNKYDYTYMTKVAKEYLNACGLPDDTRRVRKVVKAWKEIFM